MLLRRAQLTFIDSLLLLHLRQRLMQADAQGERVVVAIDELTEHSQVPYEKPEAAIASAGCSFDNFGHDSNQWI